jgi:hypothetical protein
MTVLLEVDYSDSQWMNEWTQTAYLPTAHISVAIITVLAHWTSNIWHHKCHCSLKSNTSHTIFLYFNDNLHTTFHIPNPSGLLDIRLTKNFTHPPHYYYTLNENDCLYKTFTFFEDSWSYINHYSSPTHTAHVAPLS